MGYVGNSPALKYTSFAVQHFTTSATTGYTLDHAVNNENDIRLVTNNVVQQPGSGKAYTATGTTLTLSAATTSSDTMYCVFLGKAVQTVNPGAGSVGTSQLATDAVTNVKVADDAIGVDELSATGTASSSTFLRGDNSWTDPGGVALTGSTDNTVVTVTGADAIAGEANLQFDGTDLTVSTGNVVIGTAGKGIDFSATAGTGTSELLDDYEEGTWSPTFVDNAGSTGTTSMTGSTGIYTKIGNIVEVQFYWYINSITAAPSGLYAGVGGFPFTSANDATPSGAAVWYSNVDVPYGTLMTTIEANKVQGIFYSQRDNANYGTISPSAIAASDTVYATITYRTPT